MSIIKLDRAKTSTTSNLVKKKRRQLLSLAPLVTLAACGGGASPSASQPQAPADNTPNAAPTDITLSASTVNEVSSSNVSAVVVGTLTTTDTDSGSYTYTVSDDRFEVVGNELRLKAGSGVNYETILGSGVDEPISIDITTTDSGGLTYTETFTLTVNDVNEAPHEVTLDATAVVENDAGAIIGTLAFQDDDSGDTVTYSVSDDRFEVVNGQLKLKDGIALNYENESTVTIDVTATDAGGLSFTQSFTLTVSDVLEPVSLAGFTINGESEYDASGITVSNGGDINGDGIDDFIIGARNADPNGVNNGGETYVVFGSNEGFASTISLADLDGTNGFVLNGVEVHDRAGAKVSSAGDVNGDGYDDILVWSEDADPNGVWNAGATYVVFGSGDGFTAELNLSSLDGTNGFVINGITEQSETYAGRPVASAGDINGDGYDDIVIGVSMTDVGVYASAGQSYIVYGAADGFSASIDLSNLDGTNGFVINGDQVFGGSGYAVSGAGDFNGDGIDDVIISSHSSDYNTTNAVGEAHILFGTTDGFGATFELRDIDGSNGVTFRGINSNDNMSWDVSSAGDVNGDGIDDIILGAIVADPNGVNWAGESYIVFGSTEPFPSTINLSSLDGTNGFAIQGVHEDSRTGWMVSGAGDINGDGYDDVIIGMDPLLSTAAEEAYVVFGGADGFDPILDLSSLDGTNGFVLHGINASDGVGTALSSAGDVNGDGIDDLLIGARYADASGLVSSGESYVIYGQSGNWASSYSFSDLGVNKTNSTASSENLFGSMFDDTFVFDANWGDDTISNFTDGVDMLDLADTGLVFDDLTITQNGADTYIEGVNGNSITLLGVSSSTVTVDDFIF